MSTRTTLRPHNILANGDMSLASLTTEPQLMQSLSMATFQCLWTGSSPVGVISIECSNSVKFGPDGSVLDYGKWDTMSLSVSGVPAQGVSVAGNDSSATIDIWNTAAYGVRAVYTRTSGTGSLDVIFSGKVQ